MQANCYLLIIDRECILIDAADDAQFILEEISRRNLNLLALIATHGHFDHIMAVGEIQLAMPKIPFYINNKDTFLLNRIGETAKYFLGYDPQVIPPQSSYPLHPGILKVGPFSFDIIDTPGHTPGSVSLYLKNENIVFSGDTLCCGGIGRYDFSYSDKEQLFKSVNTLLKFPRATTIYPGHGKSTFVENEKETLLDFS